MSGKVSVGPVHESDSTIVVSNSIRTIDGSDDHNLNAQAGKVTVNK